MYDVALDRLDAWASAEGVPLALFAIGADMARRESADKLRVMAERGHEIGNHTLDHLYDLTKKNRAEMRRQVESGIVVLQGATGKRPVGFRAPGYTVTDELFSVLDECGVEYDSSVFPCPPYYFAKAAAMAGIRLRGRKSRSILGPARRSQGTDSAVSRGASVLEARRGHARNSDPGHPQAQARVHRNLADDGGTRSRPGTHAASGGGGFS